MGLGGLVGHLRCQSPLLTRSERQMILLLWAVMLSVAVILLVILHLPDMLLTIELGSLLLGTVLLHPLSYELTLHVGERWLDNRPALRHAALTAIDVTIGTLFYFEALKRPDFAPQVILFCVAALAATRYPLRRTLGISTLISLLLVFSHIMAAVPLSPAGDKETLIGSVLSLYVVTYLVALLSTAERRENSIARDNERLYRTVLAHNRELNAINQLIHVLALQEDVETMVSQALAVICTALGAPAGQIYRVERAAAGHRTGELPVPLDSPPLTLVARYGEQDAAGTPGLPDEVLAALQRRDLVEQGAGTPRLSVAIPLLAGEWALGVLQVTFAATRHDDHILRPPAAPEVQTLRILASELAVALDNSLLRHKVQQAALLQEKNRIAQELHDTVAQILFSIGLGLEWCLRQEGEGTEMHAKLRDLRRLSAQGTTEIRSAIFTLSSNIGQSDLVPAIRTLVADLGQKYGLQTNIVVSGTSRQPPLLVQNAIHRIVREGVINIYKHAQATEVMVSLRFLHGMVTVVVQDNGHGSAAAVRAAMANDDNHFGLRTLQAQVADLNGLFDVYDADERGLVLRAIIPMAGAETRQGEAGIARHGELLPRGSDARGRRESA